MIDLAKVRAIDIHTHAEEPCGCHADDCSIYRRTPELNEKAAQLREESEGAASSVFEAAHGNLWRQAVKSALEEAPRRPVPA